MMLCGLAEGASRLRSRIGRDAKTSGVSGPGRRMYRIAILLGHGCSRVGPMLRHRSCPLRTRARLEGSGPQSSFRRRDRVVPLELRLAGEVAALCSSNICQEVGAEFGLVSAHRWSHLLEQAARAA